jgi:EAL domain-containing protein (putative c-di-GMP-specific phosphodiesterase class I)
VDESGQIILPDYFLKIAKKTKQYSNITKAVIKGAFDIFRNRNDEFAINLSVEDMLNAETVKYIKNYLLDYELGEKVVFEILESEGIERYDQVYDFICQMKDLGCKIAIDDFGSGYSNFEHILRLDVDYIKIDSSLIENIDKNIDSQIIVETIVDFCKKLNLSTLAEKVHSQEVYDKVVDLGVCYSQGYFIGKPEFI